MPCDSGGVARFWLTTVTIDLSLKFQNALGNAKV